MMGLMMVLYLASSCVVQCCQASFMPVAPQANRVALGDGSAPSPGMVTGRLVLRGVTNL